MSLSERLLGAQIILTDVEGAPVKIGQKVEIAKVVDPGTFDYIVVGEHDDIEDAVEALIGQKGIVVHLEYDCGCGQIFPHEPMIGVKLEDGSEHEFWFEELKDLS